MQAADDGTSAPLSWRKKLIFASIPLVALLVAIEGGARLFVPSPPDASIHAAYVEPDPDLIWRLKPGAEFQTNTLGFRDRERNQAADTTVLLLGDSVSWGDGIPTPERVYPQLLEEVLAQSGAVVEVLNTAVPGYSTFQQLRFLERDGFALEPDVVLLQFCLNDVFERYLTVFEYGGDNVFLGIDTREAVSGFLGWGVRHSRAIEALARWTRAQARDRQAYDVRKLASDELSPALEAAWDTTMSELDAVRVACYERGVPLVLMIAPYRFQLAQPGATRQPQDRLMAFARQHELPAVDLLVDFAAAQQSPEELFNDDNHFAPMGHVLAARRLGPTLLDVIRNHKR
jgi:lysophospholipase L1-like esterase